MPDQPPAITPSKSELPTKFEVVVYRRCTHDAALCESIASVRIREDSHVTVHGRSADIANSWTPLIEAAGAVGRFVSRAALKGAFDELMTADPGECAAFSHPNTPAANEPAL